MDDFYINTMKIRTIQTGERFGNLIATGGSFYRERNDGVKILFTKCICACGNPKIMNIPNRELLNGERTSCGCSRSKGKLWTWKCNSCGSLFRTRADLFRHNKNVHPTEKGIPWNKGKTSETDARVKLGREHLLKGYAEGRISPSQLGHSLTEDTRAKISESLKKAHAEGRAHNIGEAHWRGNSSPSEEEFLTIINTRFDDKQVSREMQFYRFKLDFAWPHKKKSIELDGDQHFRFESYRQRDERKNNALTSEGWQYLRIPLKDFYADKETWIQKANAFIGRPLSEEEYAINIKPFLEYEERKRKKKEPSGTKYLKVKKVIKPKNSRIKKHYFCIDCGTEIRQGAKRCIPCSLKARHKIAWPSSEELSQMFLTCKSLEELGRRLGVSGACIKKRMKRLGINYTPKPRVGRAENLMTPEVRAKAKASSIEYAKTHPKKIPLTGQYTLEGTLVRTYEYTSDIRNAGFDMSGVNKVIRGVLKSYKGFIWKRIS